MPEIEKAVIDVYLPDHKSKLKQQTGTFYCSVISKGEAFYNTHYNRNMKFIKCMQRA